MNLKTILVGLLVVGTINDTQTLTSSQKKGAPKKKRSRRSQSWLF